MPVRRYPCILAAPPWLFRMVPPEGRPPYRLLSTERLIAWGPQIQRVVSPNAHLWMWSTHSHLHDALHVIEAWGFRYVQFAPWIKLRMGLGHYLRSASEPLLFAVRGRLRVERRDLCALIEERSTRHSRKPEAAYRLIEAASPGPRLELFARTRRKGWDAWGNEVPSEIYLPPPEDGAI